MTTAALLALIEAFLTETPQLITSVENIIAAIKGKQPSAQTPLDFKDQSAALSGEL